MADYRELQVTNDLVVELVSLWRRLRRRLHLLSLFYILVLAGYPLVAAVAFPIGIPNRAASIGLRLVVDVMALSLLFRRRRYFGYVMIPLAVFWVLYAGRMFYDLVAVDQVLEACLVCQYTRPTGDSLLFAVGVTLIPMAACFAVPDENTLKRLPWVSVPVLAAISLLVLVLDARRLSAPVSGRLELDVLDAITIGNVGASMVILCGYLLLSVRRLRLVTRLALQACAVGGFVVVLKTASRGPLAGVGLALLAMAWMNRDRRSAKLVLLLGGAAGAAVIALVAFSGSDLSGLAGAVPYFVSDSGPTIVARLTDTFQAGDEVRSRLFSASWEQFLEDPWFGSGLVERTTGIYPHNLVIEAFMATGVFGGLAFVSLLLVSALASWRVLRRRSAPTWLVMIYLQYCISATVSGAIWESATFWCLMAVVIATGFSSAAPVDLTRPREYAVGSGIGP